ncbi:MAG: hypothetical protein WBW69_00455, partial [Candidatus Korobacteraceae bacterium]
IVSLRLGILEMIADFQIKATAHWISIVKGAAKGPTADQRGLWFRLPRSQTPCSPHSIIPSQRGRLPIS